MKKYTASFSVLASFALCFTLRTAGKDSGTDTVSHSVGWLMEDVRRMMEEGRWERVEG